MHYYFSLSLSFIFIFFIVTDMLLCWFRSRPPIDVKEDETP